MDWRSRLSAGLARPASLARPRPRIAGPGNRATPPVRSHAGARADSGLPLLGAAPSCSRIPFVARDLLLRRSTHLRRGESEFCEQILEWRRRAECGPAHPRARGADVAIPADHRTHFHGYARLDVGWENAIAVGLTLLLEELPRRHADHARRNAVPPEFLIGVDAECDLAAGADQDHRGPAVRDVSENIGTAADPRGRGVAGAVERRERLPGQP